MTYIFSTGSPSVQVAQRDDGVWFTRRRNLRGWGRWTRAIKQQRPASAWYNPRNGRARLPKDQ